MTSPSVHPWNGPDAVHFGLARCHKCGQVISNRDPNPCSRCSLLAWLKKRKALHTPEPFVEVVDEPRTWEHEPASRWRWWRKGEG